MIIIFQQEAGAPGKWEDISVPEGKRDNPMAVVASLRENGVVGKFRMVESTETPDDRISGFEVHEFEIVERTEYAVVGLNPD